jgi:hypothetical protein
VTADALALFVWNRIRIEVLKLLWREGKRGASRGDLDRISHSFVSGSR